ncbi:MAG: GNAT family N-acetyltransferase [Synergistaceae bacterium]|jgi:GNAT superfamily N-acetyltransferase|nr:GNAT family N-acetyltransferase [Synergistaceae bacterium]
MDNNEAALHNLRAMLRTLGRFPASGYSDEIRGLTLYDGGVDEPFENYALLDPACREYDTDKQAGDIVIAAFDFFARTGRPHHWPIFPGVPDRVCLALEERGMMRDHDFTAMAADLSGTNPKEGSLDLVSGPLRDENSAREWAECVWFGFDSDDPPPEMFASLAVNMAGCDDISLLHIAGEATGLLCAAEDSAGIYYIATMPASRGKGLGGTVVEALKLTASHAGFDKLTLLATPAGHPLYLKHGFRDAGIVKIYRSPDKNP